MYFIVVRYSGPDHDISTYYDMMSSANMSIYFFKEPIFWLGSRYLYLYINDHETVLLCFDTVSILAVIRATKNFGLPKYFIFLWFLFFAVLMGYQNVYRQFLSICFFFLSASYAYNSKLYKAAILFLISILSHNVAALFLPILIILTDFRIFKKYKNILVLLCASSVLVLLPFVVSSKSNNNTGNMGSEIYLICLALIFLYLVLINKLKLTGISSKFFIIQIYNLILLCNAILLMGSAQSKRVGMFSLCISLFCLILISEQKMYRYRAFFLLKVLIIIMPSLVFSSSFDMLLTTNNQ
ncbi:EpsG family protein [Paraglaciecola arctica]|nr:EpsG family protein [Paraglaciecola arctica]